MGGGVGGGGRGVRGAYHIISYIHVPEYTYTFRDKIRGREEGAPSTVYCAV